MDEKASKKRKESQPVELIYQPVDFGEADNPLLDRAFDILFDEVLRRRGEKEISDLTSKNN